MEVVVVVGASKDPSRYSYKAIEMLKEYGHTPLPVHPRETEVLGYRVYSDLKKIIQEGIKVDTVTMYVNPEISNKFEEDLILLKPKRVIFNPGSENPLLASHLLGRGIEVEEACTLVLLRTHQF